MHIRSSSIFTLLLVVVGMSLSAAAGATTYYVDSVNGSDGRAGTSDALSWQTIGKVSNFSLNAGDSVVFKRGCIWRETLNIARTGTAAAPLTFPSVPR